MYPRLVPMEDSAPAEGVLPAPIYLPGQNGRLFVILSADPLEVAPEELWDLEVLETIKEGETVYRR